MTIFRQSTSVLKKVRVERSSDRLMLHLKSINYEEKVSKVERDLSSEKVWLFGDAPYCTLDGCAECAG